jgi:hypothetical protein
MQALLGSSVNLLKCLERKAESAPDPIPFRRSSSMQSMTAPSPRLPRVATQPSLPHIPEMGEPAESSSPASTSSTANDVPQQSSGLGRRRCASETALCELQKQPVLRPAWLAQLQQPVQRPTGLGTRSAATLQELAVRQVCLMLIREVEEKDVGSQGCTHLHEARRLAEQLW